MHRAPLFVLVISAALAACSTRDATTATEAADPTAVAAATELLAQDATLGARLATAQALRQVSLPEACGTAAALPVGAVDASEAERLARRGYDAEALGDLQEARALLRRASELDATNEPAAYHLGRTSEALGDRAAAVAAYCRFLALTPTAAEADDARQRVARLSRPVPQVATAGVDDGAPPRRHARASAARRVSRVSRGPSPAAPRVVARAAVERPLPPASRDGDVRPAGAESVGADGVADRTAAGEVVAGGREPTVVQPSTASRTGGGGLSRAQRAGIGAAAGAILGAATGRSVKGAVIGAAAGGVLGTVMGGGIRPAGRGIRP